MKTINEINQEIEELTEEVKLLENKGLSAKKYRNRITLCRNAIKYIELNPSEEFLKAERARLKNVLASINSHDRINEFHAVIVATKRMTEKDSLKIYLRQAGVPLIKKQIARINYFLR